ncbi:hypothetical protein HMPREF9154_2955 [Arachnia propionica F0230a]|nr:hypothetical protein HMPREF9154_2955 [Arachnia propionica F0230a]
MTTLLTARSHRLERNGHDTSPPLDRPHQAPPPRPLPPVLLALQPICWPC